MLDTIIINYLASFVANIHMWVLLVSHAVVDLQYFCGGRQPREGVEDQHLMRLNFIKFVCQNNIIVTLGGMPPLDPPLSWNIQLGPYPLPPQ